MEKGLMGRVPNSPRSANVVIGTTTHRLIESVINAPTRKEETCCLHELRRHIGTAFFDRAYAPQVVVLNRMILTEPEKHKPAAIQHARAMLQELEAVRMEVV